MRIMIVEDDSTIGAAVQAAMRTEGHEPYHVTDGDTALARLRESEFDLVLLDLNLPGTPGLDVLKAIRTMHLAVPVLILSARDSVADRVAGLDLGADDYLVKPFAVPELLARVRALQRRAADEGAYHLKAADIEMDILRRRAWRAGKELDLTAKEFELLELLVRNEGRPVSREMLAKIVWRDVPRATPLDNVIDVHVARLRRKVDDPFGSRLIRTLRGVGFALGGSE